MTFKMFGMEWDFIALVIFMFVMVPLAEMSKPLFNKISICKKWMDEGNWFKLLLSWVAGGLTYFFIIHKMMKMEITNESILQFAFWTLLINGGYALIKKIYKMIKTIKEIERK